MCTVTWINGRNRLDVFFNRDERLSRKRAEPPGLELCRDGHVMAPRDGDHGGTWMGVNDRGLAVCILNNYAEAYEPPDRVRSRGLLVSDILCFDRPSTARIHLENLDKTVYRPFTLLVFELAHDPLKIVWDGRRMEPLEMSDFEMPVSSSAHRSSEVRERRRKTWLEMPVRGDSAVDRHLVFHRSHVPEKGPFSVCMHRADARTVSFSHLTVTPDRAVYRYAADAPCKCRKPHTMTLDIGSPGKTLGS